MGCNVVTQLITALLHKQFMTRNMINAKTVTAPTACKGDSRVTPQFNCKMKKWYY